MKSSEYRGPRLLSPFRMSKDKQDLVYDELWRLRSGGFDVPAMPSKRLSAGDLAVTMDAREYSDFMGMYGTEIKIDGKTLMEALSNTIKSVEYQEWDDTKRGKNLKQLGTKYGSEARARAKAEFPRIRKSLRLQEEGIKSLINPIFQNQ